MLQVYYRDEQLFDGNRGRLIVRPRKSEAGFL
jgi:hypothetical protein